MNYINFLQNKYTRWYFNIIYNAADVKLASRTQHHHILPRSLFPEYSNLREHKWNGVHLTHREHFICHWLLSKMATGRSKSKMILALHGMQRANKKQTRYSTPITGRVYEKLKIALSKVQSEAYTGMNNPMAGRSAVTEQNLRWFTSGTKTVYVAPGTEPLGYVPGRSPRIITKKRKQRPCVSPTGKIFNSLQEAALAENTSVNTIRERIRRNENNSKHRKNKSYWSFYSDVND